MTAQCRWRRMAVSGTLSGMKRTPIAALALAATLAVTLALPAAAQERLTAQEFDRYTRGKTLFYGREGQTYGAENYYANRRVLWSFLDGNCSAGEWYERDGLICFTYENNPDPQCWSFTKGPAGLIARFENEPTTTELYEAGETGDGMVCTGPGV